MKCIIFRNNHVLSWFRFFCFFICISFNIGIQSDDMDKENIALKGIYSTHSTFKLEFGSLMGQPIHRKKTTVGKFGSLFNFSINILINRESTESQYIDGGAIINLSNENEVNGCFAVHSKEKNFQRKYITHSGKDHSSTRDEKFLMGVSGHWSYNKDETISIQLTKSWRGSCTEEKVKKYEDIQLNMYCVIVSKNDLLPVDALACKHHINQSFMKKISINPNDSPRAGPFTFQGLGQKRIKKKLELDFGESWLLLGSEPGLKITSRQGIRSGRANVQFSKTPVIINEKNYLERQK